MKRCIWILLLILSPFASSYAQDTTGSTFVYQGQEYQVYNVPTDDGVTHQWALVKPGRNSSQFIDPANPDGGLIEWEGKWRTLIPVYPLSLLPVIPTADASQTPPDVEGLSQPLFDNLPLESAVLSPDGSVVAGVESQGVCVYTFSDSQKKCFDYPEGFGGTRMLYWGPDSKTIAFTEDTFTYLQESDLWTLDTTTGTYSDLTDDHVSGSWSDGVADAFVLDTIPTWNPANGDLYFVRLEKTAGESPFSVKLERIAPQGGEPQAVADLGTLESSAPGCSITDDIVVGPSLHGVMSISPNGATMAVVVSNYCNRDETSANDGIWLIDLSGQTAPRQLVNQSQLQSGMPDYRKDIALMPAGIAWAGNTGLVVTSSNLAYAVLMPANIAYYVDVASGIVIPLMDFSHAIKADFEFPTRTPYDVPFGFGVTNDGTKLIMLSAIPNVNVLTLNLPPDGNPPVRVYSGQEQPHPANARFSTVGSDGKMLIEGLLVTIHP